MNQIRSFAILMFCIVLGVGLAFAYFRYAVGQTSTAWVIGVISLVCAAVVSASIQVAIQWDKAVVLRLVHFRSLKGPGLFFIIPIIDAIPYWVDTRAITSGFKAEKTLTKDTVPVDVDAILFWKVVNPQKAALDVADYQSAISWASQNAVMDSGLCSRIPSSAERVS